MPASAIAFALAQGRATHVARILLVLIALAFLANAVAGIYHSGIEWKWWAGPQACAGTLDDLGASGGLRSRIETINVVRCDEAPWRFLGLSLAGYSALISLLLAGIAVWGAAMEWRHQTWQCPRCRFKIGCCEGDSCEASDSAGAGTPRRISEERTTRWPTRASGSSSPSI